MSERRIIKLELDAGLLLFSTGTELAVFVFQATVLESKGRTRLGDFHFLFSF